jgi:hypothetical protein
MHLVENCHYTQNVGSSRDSLMRMTGRFPIVATAPLVKRVIKSDGRFRFSGTHGAEKTYFLISPCCMGKKDSVTF